MHKLKIFIRFILIFIASLPALSFGAWWGIGPTGLNKKAFPASYHSQKLGDLRLLEAIENKNFKLAKSLREKGFSIINTRQKHSSCKVTNEKVNMPNLPHRSQDGLRYCNVYLGLQLLQQVYCESKKNGCEFNQKKDDRLSAFDIAFQGNAREGEKARLVEGGNPNDTLKNFSGRVIAKESDCPTPWEKVRYDENKKKGQEAVRTQAKGCVDCIGAKKSNESHDRWKSLQKTSRTALYIKIWERELGVESEIDSYFSMEKILNGGGKSFLDLPLHDYEYFISKLKKHKKHREFFENWFIPSSFSFQKAVKKNLPYTEKDFTMQYFSKKNCKRTIQLPKLKIHNILAPPILSIPYKLKREQIKNKILELLRAGKLVGMMIHATNQDEIAAHGITLQGYRKICCEGSCMQQIKIKDSAKVYEHYWGYEDDWVDFNELGDRILFGKGTGIIWIEALKNQKENLL